MTALFYYSISSDLTKDEIILIDKRVVKNREEVYLLIKKLPSKSKIQAKKLFVYGMFILYLGQPVVPYAAAVVIPLPPVAIHRLSPIEESRIRTNKNYPQIADIPASKVDKIRLTDDKIQQFNNLALQINSGSITMEEAVLQIRGGDGLTDVVAIIAFVIFMNWYDSLFGVKAFQANPLPHQDPLGWLSGKYDSRNVAPSPSRPTTGLKMEKPAFMSQQEYSALTKSERRQLPDPRGRDRFIDVNGSPRLDMRFNQVEYKLPKHGPSHGLPENINGKTPKTEANALALRDSLIAMGSNPDVIWYENGGYQLGTPRGYETINLFNKKTEVIAVYRKQPDGSNLFLTTCKLTRMEADHLKATNGNFVTERILKEQNSVSTFEINGMGITPISPMEENSSPNLGFTPTNNFESDAMGITPIDNSQSNNPFYGLFLFTNIRNLK